MALPERFQANEQPVSPGSACSQSPHGVAPQCEDIPVPNLWCRHDDAFHLATVGGGEVPAEAFDGVDNDELAVARPLSWPWPWSSGEGQLVLQADTFPSQDTANIDCGKNTNPEQVAAASKVDALGTIDYVSTSSYSFERKAEPHVLLDMEGVENHCRPEGRRQRMQKEQEEEGNTNHRKADFETNSQHSFQLPLAVHAMPATVTTLMVRGLPRMLQEHLLEHWPRSEKFKYDLMYMPYNVRHKCTLDYAFLNFVTHDGAVAFYNRWHGRPFRSLTSANFKANNKAIDIRIAIRQGFDANIQHWKKTLRMIHNVTFLPAIFVGDRRWAFWEFLKYVEYVGAGQASEVAISPHALSF